MIPIEYTIYKELRSKLYKVNGLQANLHMILRNQNFEGEYCCNIDNPEQYKRFFIQDSFEMLRVIAPRIVIINRTINQGHTELIREYETN